MVGRTRLCGEDVFIIQETLNPTHHIIDVGRCREVHAFTLLVDPCIAQASVILNE